MSAVGLSTAGGSRGNDHRRRQRWLAFGDGTIDGLGVVGPLGQDRANDTRDLVEQGAHHGEIADSLGRQLGGENLMVIGIHGQVKFAPRSAAPYAVLFRLPLARPLDFQTRRVDHHIGRSGRWRPCCG